MNATVFWVSSETNDEKGNRHKIKIFLVVHLLHPCGQDLNSNQLLAYFHYYVFLQDFVDAEKI